MTNLESVTGKFFNDLCWLGGAGGSDSIREILPNLRDFSPNLNGSIILNRYLKMQTEHLKYVDLVDLHH